MNSTRCGKGNCIYYDKTNKISGCHKFSDRNLCSISLANKSRVSKKSIENNLIKNY